MHAGTGGGNPANKRRLFADRPHRRFRKVVHLPAQQPRDAAGEEQGQVGRRIVCERPALPEGRDEHERRLCIDPTQALGAMLTNAKISGTALTDNQISPR